MKTISNVDYRRGALDNPDVFALSLFSGLYLTFKDVRLLNLAMGDKVILAKDNEGKYYMGKANSRLDPEAWPITWTNGPVIHLDRPNSASEAWIDIKLTGDPVKGYDQNGIIKLFKIETL